MVASMQKEMALRRKLQVLRALTKSKAVTKSSILKDALNYIKELKQNIEALNKEFGNQPEVHIPAEVKIEKTERGYEVRITCEKTREVLVSVLEVFEEKCLNVLHAKISCNPYFFMEGIIEAAIDEESFDVGDVTQAIYNALGNISKEN